MRGRLGVCALLLVTATACGHDFDPPDRAERIREASALYTPLLFDTVTWATDSIRALQGNSVYAEKCRRCHGTLGRGQTEYAAQRNLVVPSLVEPEWHLVSMDSLRRTVYVGHEEGMPGYGVAGITPREIDASAFYVLYQLRPDVLGGGSENP